MKTADTRPVILIPARMDSTRLPGKPMLSVGGSPMIVQVWRRAMESGIGDVVVACDGQAIYDAVTQAGGKAVITDPELPSGSDRIYAALQEVDGGKNYGAVINLQGDMPTINPAIIKDAAALLADPAVDIATLVSPIMRERDKTDPAVVKADIAFAPGKTHGRAVSFSRAAASGNKPPYQHIGLYVYRRPALEKFVSLPPSPLEKKEKLEQLRALEAGMHIEAAVVSDAPVGVDTPETLEEARAYYDR